MRYPQSRICRFYIDHGYSYEVTYTADPSPLYIISIEVDDNTFAFYFTEEEYCDIFSDIDELLDYLN